MDEFDLEVQEWEDDYWSDDHQQEQEAAKWWDQLREKEGEGEGRLDLINSHLGFPGGGD